MRFASHAAVVSLAVLLGCGHTKSVTEGDGKGTLEESAGSSDKDKDKETKPKAARRERDDSDGAAKKKDKGATTTTQQGVPLASSPAGLLKPGAEEKIQDKLASKGLLKSEKRGAFDEPTRDALRRFQDENDLPATGFPDHETIRKMGLDPDEMFSSKSETQQKPTPR